MNLRCWIVKGHDVNGGKATHPGAFTYQPGEELRIEALIRGAYSFAKEKTIDVLESKSSTEDNRRCGCPLPRWIR